MEPSRARPRVARPAEPGPRRLAREAALQMLYALDAAGAFDGDSAEAQIKAYWEHVDEVARAEGRAYADLLVRSVCAHRDALDDAMREAQTRWRVERMSMVDRNILRLATEELRTADDVPAAVVIDEAVELAKRFGGEESSAFVNGILERVALRLGRLRR